MDTIKINAKNTKIIAHRGLSGIEAENTNAAFIAAGNRSYYGIETDIRKTKDGIYAVNHDGNLLRVADNDSVIEENDYDTLSEIIFFDKDGSKNRNDLRITNLDNYIKICKKYGKQSILELKSDFDDSDIKEITDIINKYDYLDKVTFISFYYDPLLRIRKIYPDSSVQFLFREITREVTEKLNRDRIDVDVKYTALTKENIDMLHSLGLKVNCWTVDDKTVAEELIEMGVDFITTNILE